MNTTRLQTAADQICPTLGTESREPADLEETTEQETLCTGGSDA